MYLWCTRNPPFTHCLKELHGHPLFLPARVHHLPQLLVKNASFCLNICSIVFYVCWLFFMCKKKTSLKKSKFYDKVLKRGSLCWQITQPQPASLPTRPTQAACRHRLQLTAMVRCPFPILALLALQTAVTAEQLTAGRLKRPVRSLKMKASTLIIA